MHCRDDFDRPLSRAWPKNEPPENFVGNFVGNFVEIRPEIANPDKVFDKVSDKGTENGLLGQAPDRLYIATDAGVQVATPGTYVQVILPLPNDLPAVKVAFDGQTLYVTSVTGTFKRLLKVSGRAAGSSISRPSGALDLRFITHPFVTGTNRQP